MTVATRQLGIPTKLETVSSDSYGETIHTSSQHTQPVISISNEPKTRIAQRPVHQAHQEPPEPLIDPLDNPRDFLDRLVGVPYGVWALYFAAIGTGAAFFRYDSVYYDRRGISKAEIGIIKGLYPLSLAAGGFILPRIADATRQHRIILILATLCACMLWTSVAFPMIYTHTPVIMAISVLGGLSGGSLAPMIDAYAGLIMRYNRSSYGMARMWSSFGWGITALSTGFLINKSLNWMFVLYVSGQLLTVLLLIIFYHLNRVETRLAERVVMQQRLKQQQEQETVIDSHDQQHHSHIQSSALTTASPDDGNDDAFQIADEEHHGSTHHNVISEAADIIHDATEAVSGAVDTVTETFGAMTEKLGLRTTNGSHNSTLLRTDSNQDVAIDSEYAQFTNESSNLDDAAAAAAAAAADVPEEGSLSPLDPRVLEPDPHIQREIMHPATRNEARIAAAWVLGNLFIFGMLMSVISYYLFLFAQEELGASTNLMGYATVIMTTSELPWFWYADRILARFPLKWIFVVTELSFGIRTGCYTFLPRSQPWLLLVLEPFHGMNFALMWSAAVQAGIHFAPKGIESSYQGVINASYQGCGMALGAVLGGAIFQNYGSVVLFRITSCVAIIWSIILALFFPSHSFYRYRKHPFFAVPEYVLPTQRQGNNVASDDDQTTCIDIDPHESVHPVDNKHNQYVSFKNNRLDDNTETVSQFELQEMS